MKIPPLWRRTPADVADWFDQDTIRRARNYSRPKKRVALITSATDLVALVVIIVTHAVPRLIHALGVSNWALGVVVGAATVVIVSTVVGAPASGWTALVYDKRWELSTETPRSWAIDQAKGLAVGTTLMSIILVAVYWVIRSSPLWWVYGAALMMALSLVLLFVYPVLIMPVFNKFTPLGDDDLRQRIDRIAGLAGVSIRGSFTMDASKRSRRDNVFVAGYGKTKRVVVYDTMLEHPPHVVEQVVAHEIGHYRRQHLLSTLPAAFVATLVGFGLVDAICSWHRLLHLAGVRTLGDPGSIPLFMVVFAGTQTLTGVFTALLSRHHEREADLEALELLGEPGALIDVWRRMAPKNLMDLEPSLLTRLQASHPEAAERMAFAQAWATLNGVAVIPPELESAPA